MKHSLNTYFYAIYFFQIAFIDTLALCNNILPHSLEIFKKFTVRSYWYSQRPGLYTSLLTLAMSKFWKGIRFEKYHRNDIINLHLPEAEPIGEERQFDYLNAPRRWKNGYHLIFMPTLHHPSSFSPLWTKAVCFVYLWEALLHKFWCFIIYPHSRCEKKTSLKSLNVHMAPSCSRPHWMTVSICFSFI